MNRALGRPLLFVGLAIALLGLLVWSGALHWLGRLPGDLRFERERVRIYLPFASMLLVSAVLSFLMYLVQRFFR